MAQLPDALDLFYGQVRATPETRRFFSDEDRITDAKTRQLSHWRAISSGEFDQRFVRNVTRVGETHARIGLEPRWYIGGYAMLIQSLVAAVLRARLPKPRLGRGHDATDDLAADLGAFIKAALLDMDYSISVYLAAAESARLEAEAKTLAAERETVVHSIGEGLAALAAGDLTFRISDNLPPEYAKLRDDFNSALAGLAGAMESVAGTSGRLATGCDELATASDNLSMRTEQQAAGLEEAAAALEEINGQVKQTAAEASQTTRTAANAKSEVERSGQVVAGALESVARINESSREIEQIIGVIDEIAFQTNLLALNAGVEAARAGDAGKGFAVVASEVRALAQRSAEAAKEIKALIGKSSQQVAEGVERVQAAGVALSAIVSQVSEIDAAIARMAESAQEQAVTLAQISQTVNQMDQVVQQNAAMVEESAAATHAMKGETVELRRLVGRFRLEGSTFGSQTAADSAARRFASITGGRALGAAGDGS